MAKNNNRKQKQRKADREARINAAIAAMMMDAIRETQDDGALIQCFPQEDGLGVAYTFRDAACAKIEGIDRITAFVNYDADGLTVTTVPSVLIKFPGRSKKEAVETIKDDDELRYFVECSLISGHNWAINYDYWTKSWGEFWDNKEVA